MYKFTCPQCGSHELAIYATTRVLVIAHENDEDVEAELDRHSDFEWDDTSVAVCIHCDKLGRVSDFDSWNIEETNND